MGSEYESEATHHTPPKLSLYSLPNKAKEPSWMKTPPFYTSVSIPFQWEEAPGKPRPRVTASGESKPRSVRCLELPPRLLADQAKVVNMSSPTTVLDGPGSGRFVSRTLSFRRGGSFRSPDNKRVSKEKALFGSSRWGSFRKDGRVVVGGFDFSSPPVDDDGDEGGSGGGGAEVEIRRVRRKGRLSLSQARSRMASIYDSFKQVVPWRHGHEKIKKKGS